MIKKYYKDFNEHVYIIKLKNGMQVHILPKDDPYYSTYVELSVPYGALDLSYKLNNQTFETPYGTAHFLEHKMFAMPDGDAFMKFSSMGLDSNAMTSYNQTSYLFMATEHVMEGLDYLLEMVDTPFIHEENVESEKPIIAEELKMYLDDPNTVMHNKLMEQLYHHHPIRYDIGGTLDSIKEITSQTLNDIYHAYYVRSNRLIVIAGKVDLKAIQAYFKVYEQKYPNRDEKAVTHYPVEPKRVRVKSCVEKKDIGISKMMIGFKLQPKRLSPKDQIKREMVMSIMINLLLGSSSSMYERLLAEGLINQNFSVGTYFEKKAECIILYAESNKMTTFKRIMTDFLLASGETELKEDAFNRYLKVYMGQLIYALNNVEHKAYLYGKYFHMKSSLFDVVDLLKEVTLDDVKQSFHELKKTNMSLLLHKKA
jgi:predicted Zn-dependent peptidase